METYLKGNVSVCYESERNGHLIKLLVENIQIQTH